MVYLDIFTDIDECRAGDFTCPERSLCANTVGSYTCQCPEGFTHNHEDNLCEGGSCVFCFATATRYIDVVSDVNECRSSPCAERATCMNTQGSFHCIEPPSLTCTPGFEPNTAQSDCVGKCQLFTFIQSWWMARSDGCWKQ